MSGSWIKKQQVTLYMNTRKEGASQITAAAKAGMSERSGREIEKGRRTEPRDKARNWRTRPDPLSDVWQSELVPLLESSPRLQAFALLEMLQSNYPDKYADSVLRTLQRRVKTWRALHGPAKEVMFLQTHEIGRQGLSDFTKLKGVAITIAGKVLVHLLYHFRLAYSRFSHIKVILGGESYSAVAEGLKEALWRLGGSPKEHRTDSLSAAFKNLSPTAKDDMTTRYHQLCEHYNMEATRNNKGVSHENGSIESAHGHLKRRIEQALLLRGSYDFESLAAYQQFIDNIVAQHNRRHAKAITEEKQHLQALPEHSCADYTDVAVSVTRASTITVRRVTYTVPSRLQGETLRVRLYHDRLIGYLGATQVVILQRSHPPHPKRAYVVDYRHVIHSLVKKPQAFRYLRYRDKLLPSDSYRQLWSQIEASLDGKTACRFMVGLLQLAANTQKEKQIADYVMALLVKGETLSLHTVQIAFSPQATHAVNHVTVNQHPLTHYDSLINNKPVCTPSQEVSYG